MTESAPPFDLVTKGRIGVDLVPLRSGAPLTLVQMFGKFLGGSAANVAVAAARPGHSAAVVIRARDRAGITVFDLDRRPALDQYEIATGARREQGRHGTRCEQE